MSRRLLLALCTAALTAASVASTSAPADAHYRYRPCVLAKEDARFYPQRCHHGYHHCEWRVGGRAFRIVGEEDRSLVVWNRLYWYGTMAHRDLRLVREKFCRAAGI